MAVLAPMQPELKAIVKSFGLAGRLPVTPVFSHTGTAGDWWVGTLVTGMGPALAREATRQALSAGSIDHVMVIGIAGGLDPALPVGSTDGARAGPAVPRRARVHVPSGRIAAGSGRAR